MFAKGYGVENVLLEEGKCIYWAIKIEAIEKPLCMERSSFLNHGKTNAKHSKQRLVTYHAGLLGKHAPKQRDESTLQAKKRGLKIVKIRKKLLSMPTDKF